MSCPTWQPSRPSRQSVATLAGIAPYARKILFLPIRTSQTEAPHAWHVPFICHLSAMKAW